MFFDKFNEEPLLGKSLGLEMSSVVRAVNGARSGPEVKFKDVLCKIGSVEQGYFSPNY